MDHQDPEITSSQFGDFPLDVLIIIFNFSAAVSRQSCLNICLVSTWAWRVAIRHLYTTIAIGGNYETPRFDSIPASLSLSPYEMSPRHFIKNVWVVWLPQEEVEHLLPFLQSLDTIHMLSMFVNDFWCLVRSVDNRTVSIPVLETPQIKQSLHLTLYGLPTFELNYSITSSFPAITHLQAELTDGLFYILPCLPNLTHIHLTYSASRNQTTLLRGIQAMPSLRFIAVAACVDGFHGMKCTTATTERWVIDTKMEDRRVHIGVEHAPAFREYRKAWEEQASGETASVWEMARSFTEQLEMTEDRFTSKPLPLPRPRSFYGPLP